MRSQVSPSRQSSLHNDLLYAATLIEHKININTDNEKLLNTLIENSNPSFRKEIERIKSIYFDDIGRVSEVEIKWGDFVANPKTVKALNELPTLIQLHQFSIMCIARHEFELTFNVHGTPSLDRIVDESAVGEIFSLKEATERPDYLIHALDKVVDASDAIRESLETQVKESPNIFTKTQFVLCLAGGLASTLTGKMPEYAKRLVGEQNFSNARCTISLVKNENGEFISSAESLVLQMLHGLKVVKDVADKTPGAKMVFSVSDATKPLVEEEFDRIRGKYKEELEEYGIELSTFNDFEVPQVIINDENKFEYNVNAGRTITGHGATHYHLASSNIFEKNFAAAMRCEDDSDYIFTIQNADVSLFRTFYLLSSMFENCNRSENENSAIYEFQVATPRGGPIDYKGATVVLTVDKSTGECGVDCNVGAIEPYQAKLYKKAIEDCVEATLNTATYIIPNPCKDFFPDFFKKLLATNFHIKYNPDKGQFETALGNSHFANENSGNVYGPREDFYSCIKGPSMILFLLGGMLEIDDTNGVFTKHHNGRITNVDLNDKKGDYFGRFDRVLTCFSSCQSVDPDHSLIKLSSEHTESFEISGGGSVFIDGDKPIEFRGNVQFHVPKGEILVISADILGVGEDGIYNGGVNTHISYQHQSEKIKERARIIKQRLEFCDELGAKDGNKDLAFNILNNIRNEDIWNGSMLKRGYENYLKKY